MSSYAPLLAMCVLLFFQTQFVIAMACGAIAVLSVVVMYLYLRLARQLAGVPTRIVEAHSRDEEVMSYIVTYILPFIAVAFGQWQQQVALLVFFLLVAFLYIKLNLIHINPTLLLFGYRVYEATLDDGTTFNLIAKGRTTRGSTHPLMHVDEDIVLETRA
jgi:hypothetical protein